MTQGLDDGVELKSGGGGNAERSVKPRVLNPWEAQASGPLFFPRVYPGSPNAFNSSQGFTLEAPKPLMFV